jgi:hypothetical protein
VPESTASAFAFGGEDVTYLLAIDRETGRLVDVGERPHCRMWEVASRSPRCEAQHVLTDVLGSESMPCTRYADHQPPHVHHDRPGLPLLAWVDGPTSGGCDARRRDEHGTADRCVLSTAHAGHHAWQRVPEPGVSEPVAPITVSRDSIDYQRPSILDELDAARAQATGDSE